MQYKALCPQGWCSAGSFFANTAAPARQSRHRVMGTGAGCSTHTLPLCTDHQAQPHSPHTAPATVTGLASAASTHSC